MTLPRIPHRLEHVRKELQGIDTLREFHERLGGEDFVSYSAVRNYHLAVDNSDRMEVRFGQEVPKDERVAPVAYLARVADVFGVRLEWLATGEGEVTEAEERERQAIEGFENELKEAVRGIPFLEGQLHSAHFFSAFLRLYPDGGRETADKLARLLIHPLVVLGVDYLPHGSRFTDYVHAMTHALMLLPWVKEEARQYQGDLYRARSPQDDLALLDDDHDHSEEKEETDGTP